MRRILFAAALLAFWPHGRAETLALGSIDLKACSKGKERATLVLEIEAPNFQRVRDELQACAAHGVAAATLPALIEDQPGAAPVFWEEFELCSRYTEWISAELSIQTACRSPGLRRP